MKKVGLITCFIDNYGACLQAYAMQTKINSFNNYCEIINYVEPDGYRQSSKIIDKLKKNKITYFISSIINKRHKIVYLKIKKFDKFRKKYLNFSKKVYYTSKQVENDANKYDCFVCGSDQIWNPTFYNGNNLVYTLGVVPDNIKKVSYAASIGISKFPDEYINDFKKLMERIDYVSVREQDGVDIINSLIPDKARLVLDPTLLLNKDDWNKIASNRLIKNDYIVVYMFGERDDLYNFIDLCHKKTGLDVVIICVETKNLNNNYMHILNAGPEDFISLIRDAKLVITDSFHATAFSINLNTPFYSLLRCDSDSKNNMNSRIYSILDLFKLNNRLVTKFDETFNVNFNVDFEESNKILERKRNEDSLFFERALKND